MSCPDGQNTSSIDSMLQYVANFTFTPQNKSMTDISQLTKKYTAQVCGKVDNDGTLKTGCK
jgi:hypothetical protein